MSWGPLLALEPQRATWSPSEPPSEVPGGRATPTLPPGSHPAIHIQPLPRTKPLEAVGRGWRAGVSLQTPQLQESPNRVSSPRTAASGLMGPRPLPEKSQRETIPLSPHARRGAGRRGSGPGLLVPGALAPESMDIAPSLPYPPQSNQEHFLRVSFIVLGGPRVERGNPSIQLTSLRGKVFARSGPFLQPLSTSPLTARGHGTWAPPPASC